MFHDYFVKAKNVLTLVGRKNETLDRNRRTSRRFTPQLGRNTLESRISPSTITITLVGPSAGGQAPVNTDPSMNS